MSMYDDICSNNSAHSEILNSCRKKNAKFTKQQEMKEGLDECIRMKKALKLEEKQMELEEDT